jgi:hypothetical protein
MKKLAIAVAFIVVAFLVGVSLRAQSPQAYTMSGGAAHTTCTTPASGAYFLCVATDGVWVSNNGAAYFQIVQQRAASPTLTINGTTKTLPASFTISSGTVPIPAGSGGAPSITAN